MEPKWGLNKVEVGPRWGLGVVYSGLGCILMVPSWGLVGV